MRVGLDVLLWCVGNMRGVVAGLVLVLLGGCAAGGVPLSERIRVENDRTADIGVVWHESVALVEGLQLAIVKKEGGEDAEGPLRIYIEGDGRAYVSKGRVSGDPTPRHPVGLALALADGDDAVMYVARPCQWLRGPECKDRSLWTTQRFSERMAQAYTELVRRESGGRAVELVGYSGGAWVALQVAARLENVGKVTTVAGNLMPDFVNAHHKVTPMAVAGYPAGRLEDLPVVAYVGTRDAVVPRGVVEDFVGATGAQNVTVIEVDASHGEGWEAVFGTF